MARLLFLVLSLALSGCTFMYRHSYEAQFSPPLQKQETAVAFEQVKQHLISKGAVPIALRTPAPNYFEFPAAKGKMGLLREPFNDYVAVVRSEDGDRISVSLTRIISHPIEFTSEQIRQFISKTEEYIHEATSRQVKLVLEEKRK